MCLDYVLDWVEVVFEVQIFLLPFSFDLLDDFAVFASFVRQTLLVLVLDLTGQARVISVLLTLALILTGVLLELTRRLLIVSCLASASSLHLLREECHVVLLAIVNRVNVVLSRSTLGRPWPLNEFLIVF